jgi:hypothetical protein
MGLVPVTGPSGHRDQVLPGSHTEPRQPRSRYQPTPGPPRALVVEPAANGRVPHVTNSSALWRFTAGASGRRPAWGRAAPPQGCRHGKQRGVAAQCPPASAGLVPSG